MLARWISAVIGSPRFSSALPPRATRTRIVGAQLPSVATSMALIVCRRFSAWSNTMLAGDSNTSPVTSRPVAHPGVLHHLPADDGVRVVERGQAVHELDPWVAGLLAAAPRSPGTARAAATRSSHTSFVLAHRHPHVGVDEVDARRPRRSASSVIVTVAPVASGDVVGDLDDVVGRRAATPGPTRRTSAPISAPITSSERPMLNRQSPTNAYDSASYGLPLASCIVRKSASICVGCHSLVSPL